MVALIKEVIWEILKHTIKKKLNKCKNIFYAYNDIQFRYGEVLDKRSDIVEIRCNVKLDGFILGDNYTTDFYCIKDNLIVSPLVTQISWLIK